MPGESIYVTLKEDLAPTEGSTLKPERFLEYRVQTDANLPKPFYPVTIIDQIQNGDNNFADMEMIDFDGDGDLDIAVVINDFLETTNAQIELLENDGSQNFTSLTVFSTSYSSINELKAADINGDGTFEFVATSANNNAVILYDYDASSNTFTEQLISNQLREPRSVYLIDMDADGDVDILTAFSFDNTVAWFEIQEA
ncbi:FG-GAP repeat domain-containing protein [Mesonia maritima]|uniref:FG-GAP repeat domain-containing protein n=1 Tax=Mesonia maritima TaxID=1793873 RepID=UPI003644A289